MYNIPLYLNLSILGTTPFKLLSSTTRCRGHDKSTGRLDTISLNTGCKYIFIHEGDIVGMIMSIT